MSIYESAVRKPITTFLIFVAVVIFGLYSLSRLPIDLYPEMEYPAISIFTMYNGAGAKDIETNITKPIEDGMSSISDLKEINSVSRDNMSVIFIEFEWGTNLDEAANDIRDALSFVEDMLPEDAEDPTIFKFNTSMMPILFYAVTADESYEGLEKILDEKLVNPLNRIDGIGSIGFSGMPGREITVQVDPRRLDAYNLTVEQIGNILRAENLNMPSGNVKMGQMDYPLRVEGEFSNSSEIKKIVVGNYNGQSIYLEDVASVRDSVREMSVIERIGDQKGVRMYVMKQSGGNTVRISREIKDKLEEIKENLPPDIEIQTIFDSSEFINHSISNLSITLFFALLFVTLVVLFFLGRWRATFIIVLTIPISLIVSFIYLGISGNSVNIISLSSLSIAIGMVVDDAIVVLENITKHIERGSSPREAAIYATNEVWLAVIVTTLTVVAVFFPLTLVSGMTGMFFKQLGWIVTITIVTSTIAAISLTPMLCSKLLKNIPKQKDKKKVSFNRVMLKFLDKVDAFYGKTISWVLHHKIFTGITAFVIFIGTMMLLPTIGTEFIPQTDQSQINFSFELQVGTRVEETFRVSRIVDEYLKKNFPEIDLLSTSCGSDDSGGLAAMFRSSGSHIANYQIGLSMPDQRNRNVWEIAEAIRQKLAEIPEIVKYTVSTESGMGMGSDNSVEVSIYGFDLEKTTQIAEQIADKVETIPGAREIKISREEFKPELQVLLDRQKMALHGLNTAMVSTAIRNRVEGLTATRFRQFGDEFDVIVNYDEQYRNSITDIENITITSPMGMKIRLKELGKVTEQRTPPNIERRSRERIVNVTAVPYKISLGELAEKIKVEMKDIDIPREMYTEVGGAYEDQQESFADLGLLMLLSLLLVYIVMASQFESFKMPLIIMFSIPFSFSGVILALFVTGKNLSVIAALGAVLLIGIVVKNAIVLVDYINLMRDRGNELYEAVILSGKSRLRPVLMTALTTILGMTPMAVSTGQGAEIWSPMGISVIGGLIFSTILTMIIVPVMYVVFARKGERNKKIAYRKKYRFMDE